MTHEVVVAVLAAQHVGDVTQAAPVQRFLPLVLEQHHYIAKHARACAQQRIINTCYTRLSMPYYMDPIKRSKGGNYKQTQVEPVLVSL